MVNMYKLELTILQQEILRYLSIKAGLIVNARKLAKELQVSQPAISKAIPGLDKKGWIKVEKDKESGRYAITLNRDNPLITGVKRAENLGFMYECGLITFLEDNLSGATVILFGSYSRGEDNLDSDIDIAVIGTKEKNINFEKFEKLLERKIIIQFYPSFSEIHKNLRESILNGILLKGSVRL